MKKPPFDELVRTHSVRILRFCRSMHAQPADAEDAYSEAFLAALRGYGALPEDANLEAWLITIARHACIDVHRRNARRATPVDQVPEPVGTGQGGSWPGGFSRSGGPGSPGRGSADGIDVFALLWRLTDRQREAVAYHHVWGLPYAEVAAQVGGTPAAARRAAADGIAALRRMIEEETP